MERRKSEIDRLRLLFAKLTSNSMMIVCMRIGCGNGSGRGGIVCVGAVCKSRIGGVEVCGGQMSGRGNWYRDWSRSRCRGWSGRRSGSATMQSGQSEWIRKQGQSWFGHGRQGRSRCRSQGQGVRCGRRDRLVGQRLLTHHRIEAMMRIGCVVDCAFGAVGIDNRIAALDHIAVSRLMLTLQIARVAILYVIAKRILWIGIIGLGSSRLGRRSCSKHIQIEIFCMYVYTLTWCHIGRWQRPVMRSIASIGMQGTSWSTIIRTGSNNAGTGQTQCSAQQKYLN